MPQLEYNFRIALKLYMHLLSKKILSVKQQLILELMQAGHSVQQISAITNLSEITIKIILKKISKISS